MTPKTPSQWRLGVFVLLAGVGMASLGFVMATRWGMPLWGAFFGLGGVVLIVKAWTQRYGPLP